MAVNQTLAWIAGAVASCLACQASPAVARSCSDQSIALLNRHEKDFKQAARFLGQLDGQWSKL